MTRGSPQTLSRSVLLQLIGWAISLSCLWLAVQRTDLEGLGNVWKEIQLPLLAAALLANAARVYALIVRWRYLLGTVNAGGWKLAAETLSFSYALNSLLPARLGDLVRIGASSRLSKQPIASMTALLVIERVQDLLSIVLLVLLALPFLPESLKHLGASLGNILLLGLLILAAIVLLAVLWKRHRRSRPSGGIPAEARVRRWIQQGWQTARVGVRPAVLMKTSSLSLLSWSLEVFTYWLVFRAIGLALPAQDSLVVCALGSSVTMIPSAPAAMGTYELAVQSILQAYGTDPTVGLGAAVLLHLVVLGPVTVAGLVLWPRWAPELAKARKQRQRADQSRGEDQSCGLE